MEDLIELKEREIRMYFEEEDMKDYLRLVKKYGAPKNEYEEELLWEKAESNVIKRKKTKKLIDEYLELGGKWIR